MFLGSSLLFIHIYFLFCVLQSVKLSCLKTPHVLVQLGPRLSGQVKGHSDPTLPLPLPFPTRAKMATSGALRISMQVLLPVITLLLSLLLTGSNASKYQETDNFSILVPLTGSSLISANLLKSGVITKKGGERDII